MIEVVYARFVVNNVNLTKKEGTYYWKCGARALKKKTLSSEGLVFLKLEVNFRKHPVGYMSVLIILSNNILNIGCF